MLFVSRLHVGREDIHSPQKKVSFLIIDTGCFCDITRSWFVLLPIECKIVARKRFFFPPFRQTQTRVTAQKLSLICFRFRVFVSERNASINLRFVRSMQHSIWLIFWYSCEGTPFWIHRRWPLNVYNLDLKLARISGLGNRIVWVILFFSTIFLSFYNKTGG